MTFDWLKTLLGDAYTEDIDKTVATEIGKRFTAKADFEAKSTELKNAKAQLAEANKTIEGLQAADNKAKAEQAEKDAAAQLDAYKFDTWFDGLVAQNHGRDGAVIRTLAGTERMDALRKSQNRDADGKALFNDLLKNSAYAFEDQTPPPPPYAGGTGSASAAADDAAMRAAMGLPAEKK